MSVCLWDTNKVVDALIIRHDNHKEFVQGIDWSPIAEGQVCSVSWDMRLYVWNVMQPQPLLQ